MNKTIKANKFAKAKEALNAIRKGLGKNLKEVLPWAERKMFHVALVKVEDQPGEAENKLSVQQVQYNKRSFDKMSKNSNFKFHGFSNLIVLHNPDEMEEEEEIIVPQHVTDAAAQKVKDAEQSEIDKKIEAAKQKAVEDYKAEQAKLSKSSPGSDIDPEEGKEVPVLTMEDIAMMNEDKLDAFAEENKIDLEGLEGVDEKRSQALTWYNNQQKDPNAAKHDLSIINSMTQGELLQFAKANKIPEMPTRTDNKDNLVPDERVKKIRPVILEWAKVENAKED